MAAQIFPTGIFYASGHWSGAIFRFNCCLFASWQALF